MFRLAVITYPERLPDEIHALRMVGNLPRVCAVHMRKPGYSQSELRALLEALPPEVRGKVRLHDHFELCREYAVQGVHLNQRNPTPPAGIHSVSAGCHSLSELQEKKAGCEYVFLSPIFDSISKQGYKSNFSPELLENAARNGVIDKQVFALGGVRAEHFPLLRHWGFGGAALLGEIWQEFKENPDLERFARHLSNILHKVDQA